MNRILVFYPALFACRSKFDRKVRHLTQRLGDLMFDYIDDPNGFIVDYASAIGARNSITKVGSIFESKPDYAIVFDDGEEFVDERQSLEGSGVSVRWVRIPITRVVNISRKSESHYVGTENYEYIGRGSYWGNPHSMYEAGEDRKEVIRKYQYDFDYEKFINIDPSRVHELAGKRLGCFCKPADCHGDVLANYLNAFDDGS